MTNPLLARPNDRDDTMARLLADALGDRVAFTPELGWLVWDRWRWRVDAGDVRVRGVVADWLRPLILDAVDWLDRNGANGAAISAMTRGLQVKVQADWIKALQPLVLVEVEDWDAYPHLLNTPTGVVDLRDGTLLPHDPALRLTLGTSVGYVAGATHPDWERALQCQPQDDDRAWLQARLGSGCWGHQREDSLALLTGHGSNGKSTVMSGVRAALGDYASLTDRSVIVGKGHEAHKARLRGRRLVLVEELDDGHRLNMAEVKGLLGTESVSGRHLYKEAMEFTPQFTLVVTTNYKPQVPDTDHGTWRRLVRLDFGVRYEGAEKDAGLRRRCRTGK